MSNQIAFIVGVAILAITILFANIGGRYQIAAGSDAHGNPIVWRLNTHSGQVQNCYLDRNPGGVDAPAMKMVILCNPE
jgi:hypothetical protein